VNLRLVCLSDTHGRHAELVVPAGDVLVHAGDFTSRGREREVADFGEWLAAQPHAHKIVVAGNHDFLFEREPLRARELLGQGVRYLQDSGADVAGLTFWGSPWQPWFHDWAFNLQRGAPLAEVWARVPSGVDVLVTHSPPMGVLDRTAHGQRVGCEALRDALPRIAPRLHVFGHIHEAYGIRPGPPLSVNACNCDLSYQAVQAPVVVEWDERGPRIP
jgi:Icc-related predicted phosphoesterase